MGCGRFRDEPGRCEECLERERREAVSRDQLRGRSRRSVCGAVSRLRRPGRLGADVRQRLSTTDAANGTVTVKTTAEASRVDAAAGTAQTYRVALSRILPRIGDGPLAQIDVAAVTDRVAELSTLKRESIRKTLSVLAQVLDHARVQPNRFVTRW